jgi:histidinol-phosphate aminotransferase
MDFNKIIQFRFARRKMKKSITINELIDSSIVQLSAYSVADSSGFIKLDAMENPYVWDKQLIEKWSESLKTISLNRYPDASARILKHSLRKIMQVPDNADIILGNGSDELIQMLILTFKGKNKVLLAPEPTFVMYRLLSQIIGMNYVGISLQATDFSLNLPEMLSAIDKYHPSLIFLAYPNNPTGNAFKIKEIETILQASSGMVVIDEAYAPFSNHTFMPYLCEYPNLLVMRTVSKLGLAGLRLGILAGHPDWLAEIEKTRLPYNINTLTQFSAHFALNHYAMFEAQTATIRKDRENLLNTLNTLSGISAFPSQANFILLRVPNANAVFSMLKTKGILIKNLHNHHPLLNNCLRVTVGTPEENQAFITALMDFIE